MSRARSIVQQKWFVPVVVVGVVAVVFLQNALFGNSSAEVERELREKYGIEQIRWEGNGRYQRDTLVVDGEDVSDECVVTGDWGPLDDLAIECDGDTSFTPVER